MQESLVTGSTLNWVCFLHVHEFCIFYFTHGCSHSFPVFVQYNSCNPVSNALIELNLSPWTTIDLLFMLFQRSLVIP